MGRLVALPSKSQPGQEQQRAPQDCQPPNPGPGAPAPPPAPFLHPLLPPLSVPRRRQPSKCSHCQAAGGKLKAAAEVWGQWGASCLWGSHGPPLGRRDSVCLLTSHAHYVQWGLLLSKHAAQLEEITAHVSEIQLPPREPEPACSSSGVIRSARQQAGGGLSIPGSGWGPTRGIVRARNVFPPQATAPQSAKRLNARVLQRPLSFCKNRQSGTFFILRCRDCLPIRLSW